MNRLYLWFDMFYSLFTDWRRHRRHRRHRRRIHKEDDE